RVVVASAVDDEEDRRHDREEQRPQQDRTCERGPHAGDRVQQRRHGRVVLCDVGEREVVRDERVLHRTDREQHAAQHEHDESTALQPRRHGAADRAQPELDDLEDEPERGADERDDDPERPERRGHHRVEPSGALTRPGYCATYDAECLMRIWFESNRLEDAVVKLPTTTTGMFDLKRSGGDPTFTTSTDRPSAPLIENDAPVDVGRTVPGTTTPSRRIEDVPIWARWLSA